MSYNLDKRLEREIISMARRFGIKKLILFGSRARGTNRERSDIDLAATGGDIDEFAEKPEQVRRVKLLLDNRRRNDSQ